jgi:hypothetical protein
MELRFKRRCIVAVVYEDGAMATMRIPANTVLKASFVTPDVEYDTVGFTSDGILYQDVPISAVEAVHAYA